MITTTICHTNTADRERILACETLGRELTSISYSQILGSCGRYMYRQDAQEGDSIDMVITAVSPWGACDNYLIENKTYYSGSVVDYDSYLIKESKYNLCTTRHQQYCYTNGLSTDDTRMMYVAHSYRDKMTYMWDLRHINPNTIEKRQQRKRITEYSTDDTIITTTDYILRPADCVYQLPLNDTQYQMMTNYIDRYGNTRHHH